jgi:acid stress-induced BolA-like protein IbaG/YrbA
LQKNREIFVERTKARIRMLVSNFMLQNHWLVFEESELVHVDLDGSNFCVVVVKCSREFFVRIEKQQGLMRKYLADHLQSKYVPKIILKHIEN